MAYENVILGYTRLLVHVAYQYARMAEGFFSALFVPKIIHEWIRYILA